MTHHTVAKPVTRRIEVAPVSAKELARLDHAAHTATSDCVSARSKLSRLRADDWNGGLLAGLKDVLISKGAPFKQISKRRTYARAADTEEKRALEAIELHTSTALANMAEARKNNDSRAIGSGEANIITLGERMTRMISNQRPRGMYIELLGKLKL